MREAEAQKHPRRPLSRRFSATHILTAIVVILAFVLNFLVLQDRRDTTLIATAGRQMPVGSAITASDIQLVPVASGFEGLSSLVTEGQLESLDGYVLRESLSEGDLIGLSMLVAPSGPTGLRSMSIPVPIEHAAGGSLGAGDLVDVVTVDDGVAEFVVAGLEVLGVAEANNSGIGSTGGYHIIVAVTAEQSLRVAEAIDAGSIEVVKATGAPDVGETLASP
jgi:Flp pilus assembly protein CpaB